MKNKLLKGALGAGLVAVQLMAPAADLDLYANPPLPPGSTDVPNVLFIVDNTANWTQAFLNERSALASVVATMPEGKFKVGIMLATETGGQNNSTSGGYVRAAIRPMDAANKAKYEALVRSFNVNDDKSSGGASGVQMAEAYAYFAGRAAYSGNLKEKTDYTGNTAGTTQSNALYSLAGNALTSKAAANYNSPVPSGSCARNYIIYISNGANQESASDDVVATEALRVAAGGGAAGARAIATIPIAGGSEANPMDEWARFMRNSALGITTFTIDVDRKTSGQGPDWTKLLKSTSGTENYVSVSSGNGGLDIAKAINEALSKIQSVNSVFAAVSLPASANIQGAYLNQLYVGMFRPDELSKPRWLGNLKQYQVGDANNLVDSLSHDAINSATGFIAECAVSYWTPPLPAVGSTTDTYWINSAKGACIPPGSNQSLYANADSPDGNIVEKGAQAYRLRSITPAQRRVFTCATSWADCTSLLAFDGTTATAAALGVATTADRDSLIEFTKGTNLDAELLKTTTEMRPSVHGDVIHSNPLALSFGNDVVVFYGSNDGMLHAINGNQTRAYGSYQPGDELWAFIPPEFFPSLSRLRTNTDRVSVSPPVGTARTGSPKPYGIDGPVTTYRSMSGTTITTKIYAAMRRGGRAVYSFNVTNPRSPELLWKSGCAAAPATDCTLGADEIGQTWSPPSPTKIANGGTDAVVLVMGGGYDDCEDPDVNTCTSAGSKGHNIMVLDAATGAVLKVLPTDRGVVDEVKFVPDDQGRAKYGYAADLGGNLYRITVGTAAPSGWTITKIASLGCATATTSCASNRKFLLAPSVIVEVDGGYSMYIGTGDREKPLNSTYFPQTAAVTNYFFKVTDNPTRADWLTSEHATCGADIICLASLTSAGAVDGVCGAAEPPVGKGWALALRPTEQVVTTAATRFGITTFHTHMPEQAATGVCTARLGKVHVYNLNIGTATPARNSTCNDLLTGGGLPPPPKKVDICMNADCSDLRGICVGCAKCPLCSDPDNDPVGTLGSNAKRRVYWYIQK